MNLVYTHDIFSAQKYGGISRYFFELIRRIPSDKANIRVFAGLHINEYIKGLAGFKGIKIPSLKHTSTIRMDINALLQRLMLSRWKDKEIIHQTYHNRFTPSKKVKYVINVHDMITERFPEYFLDQNKTSDLKKQCCEHADKIIAVSNSTKRDLVSLFGIDPDKITVIYHGSSLNDDIPCFNDTISPGPYMLYVGKRGGYKIFRRLLRAFSQSNIIKNDFHLICFGSGPFDDIEKKS